MCRLRRLRWWRTYGAASCQHSIRSWGRGRRRRSARPSRGRRAREKARDATRVMNISRDSPAARLSASLLPYEIVQIKPVQVVKPDRVVVTHRMQHHAVRRRPRLCRALGIPARFVTYYAFGLSPPDLHAVFEAYLDGRWWLFDATRQAALDGLVRIGLGRDAARSLSATQIWIRPKFGSKEQMARSRLSHERSMRLVRAKTHRPEAPRDQRSRLGDNCLEAAF